MYNYLDGVQLDNVKSPTNLDFIPRRLAADMQLLSQQPSKSTLSKPTRRTTMNDHVENNEETMTTADVHVDTNHVSEPNVQEIQAHVGTLSATSLLSCLDNTVTLTVIPRVMVNVCITDNSEHSNHDFAAASKATGYALSLPLRPAKEDKPQGILRPLLKDAKEYFTLISKRQVTLVGDSQQLVTSLDKMATSMLNKIKASLPVLKVENELYAANYDLSSVYTVDAWPSVVSDGSGESVAYVNLVLTVNQPAIYKTEDKAKLVSQNLNLLARLFDNQAFPFYFAVTIATDQLRDASVRELVNAMLTNDAESKEEQNFVMYTRNAMAQQLQAGNRSDILPLPLTVDADVDEVLDRLFVYGGDMLFIKE